MLSFCLRPELDIVHCVEARSVDIDGPLDLRSTLSSVSKPWGRFKSDGWWRPMRTPDGPATLHLRRDRQAAHARAWGEGSSWALGRLESWIGLTDDPDAFDTDHPLVSSLHRKARGRRFASTGLVHEALVAAISMQKVTGKEAMMALRQMTYSFSDPAPGPMRLRLPPDPERLANARYHDFHRMQMERRRADVLIKTAREATRINRLMTLEATAARKYLERFPGIGVWSSAETVAVSHGDPDAVSVGDYHLKHHVAWHLAGEERGTDERMLELLAPFQPHRGRVARLLEQAGGYPTYGPRFNFSDFRDH